MGPIESLQFHLADPKNHNIFTSAVGNEMLVAVVVLSFCPMFLVVRVKHAMWRVFPPSPCNFSTYHPDHLIRLLQAYKNFGGDGKEEFRPIPW